MEQIDPEASEAVDELALLFERDYQETGRDLNDPVMLDDLIESAEADMEHFMAKYDDLLSKINGELRKAGATEAQINWGLFGDVELPTASYLRCNLMAKKLIQCSYQITYCLGELKMLSRYTDNVQHDELEKIRKDYVRRFG